MVLAFPANAAVMPWSGVPWMSLEGLCRPAILETPNMRKIAILTLLAFASCDDKKADDAKADKKSDDAKRDAKADEKAADEKK